MGYFRIVEYGDIVETFSYQRDISTKPKKTVSQYHRKRQKAIRELNKSQKLYKRSQRSVKRSKDAFFRLCHHNNCNALSINFVTLTFQHDYPHKKASRYVADFFQRVQKNYPQISIRYISVSELTKKGRWHFHLLIYDLPPETASRERETRNFQRLFQRGYIDISVALYNSSGIAGYMAKYMAKSLCDSRYESIRGYSCSRNIKKGTSLGFNSTDEYTAMSIPQNVVQYENVVYPVPYLGDCAHLKLRKIKYESNIC